MEDRVKKFKSIFYGLDRAYGQYKSDGQSVNGKAGGQAYILKKPVTDQLWIDHIEGKDPSLGIIPIRDDSTCIWGCIDIDTYPLDHKKIIRKIRELKLFPNTLSQNIGIYNSVTKYWKREGAVEEIFK